MAAGSIGLYDKKDAPEFLRPSPRLLRGAEGSLLRFPQVAAMYLGSIL